VNATKLDVTYNIKEEEEEKKNGTVEMPYIIKREKRNTCLKKKNPFFVFV
jgi:hypothetical protein